MLKSGTKWISKNFGRDNFPRSASVPTTFSVHSFSFSCLLYANLMSNPPKLLISIVVAATRILGKAFLEAGRQAVKNAKHAPQNAIGADVAGVSNATSGTITDQLTRQHRMTLDEAHLILNIKRGESMENVLKHYEHLFKANSPPPPLPKPQATGGKVPPPPAHSHYLQSKVVRARERIEAEVKAGESPAPANPGAPGADAPPPSTASRAADGS
ncbi:hypothetical protein PLEOSDRAFT_1112729 [Pleurotus ostreatus PC15]|uniref:Mitochondrial import inner membrane translocase subunit TIM16 n=1 Tax=Pleurotus ostreatus (strain PC15) TaxID=1137138 RepID=A0A067NW61_PLEO1|nr:hypothetical protein PLEOSDRAFT_1112729 [Pleurotus ostreatus PC15]